jgi:hypothetical protein
MVVVLIIRIGHVGRLILEAIGEGLASAYPGLKYSISEEEMEVPERELLQSSEEQTA